MSTPQLHKRLSQEQVVSVLENYLAKEIDRTHALTVLNLKQSQFHELLKRYQEQPDSFTLTHGRTLPNNHLSKFTEKLILNELKKEKQLINNQDIAIRSYNYSAIRDILLDKHNVKVSVTTIINRAKKWCYYQEKKEKRVHDREVLTNFIGELVQHDSSHHLWSPYMDKKLYLITSIDDHSRLLLYADLVERETTWTHIEALKSVVLRHGCSFKYYADQHRIFRYVKNRDKQSPWTTYTKFTDDVNPQWKQVLLDCNIEPIYALSPQAKGKIERPYRWLQDRIVRTASKQKVKTIKGLRTILQNLVDKYNNTWLHSTTKQIPIVRYESAYGNGQSLFKEFKLPQPYQELDDIFCLRAQRRVSSYRRIHLEGMEIQVPHALPKDLIDLKLVPDYVNNIVKVRFWQGNRFLGSQNLPLEGFRTIVRF